MPKPPPSLDARQNAILQWLRKRGHAVIFRTLPVDWEPPPQQPGVRIKHVRGSSVLVMPGMPLWPYVDKPCLYCEMPMASQGGKRPTRDHIKPRSLGYGFGHNGKNRLIVCQSCNNDKGNSLPDQFLNRLERRGDRRAAIVRAVYVRLGIISGSAEQCGAIRVAGVSPNSTIEEAQHAIPDGTRSRQSSGPAGQDREGQADGTRQGAEKAGAGQGQGGRQPDGDSSGVGS